jgi:DNA-binding transcriptional LysR family regulator
MDDLRRMAIFAAVVRHGSMSGAGRELGMSASAVSQQIRALERTGGVTLLHRSTRKLALTEAGARFHVRCAELVAAAEQARAELQSSRETPSGELRLAATVGFGAHVQPALGAMLDEYPALRLSLLVDDAAIDLIESRIDLAIRYGRLKDSNWVAKRLGSFDVWVCAAPEYLARHAAIQTPDDVKTHSWLSLNSGTFALALVGEGKGKRGKAAETNEALQIAPRVVSNNQLTLQQMCVDGMGLALLGSIDVHADIAAGRLVRLLPDWSLPGLDIWAVTPQRDAQPAKVRMAIAVLEQHFRTLPGVKR